MKTLLILCGIIATLLLFSLYVALSYAQIFEDQYLLCNHENECQVQNIDDLNATKIEYNFAHDLDTFDLVS